MNRKILICLVSLILMFSLGNFKEISANSKANYSATLQGKLLKSNGKPLPYTEIELVPINSDKIINDGRLLATSNTSGKFSFINVPNGKYTLSINFDDKPTDLSPYATFFYPNTYQRSESEIFEITETSKTRTINFQLPPALVQRSIKGKVLFEDGTTAADAYIAVQDTEFDKFVTFGRIVSDDDGNFTFKGFESRKYQLGGILFEKAGRSEKIGKTLINFGQIIAAGETKIFVLDSTTPNIKLILKESEDFKRMRQKYIGKLIVEK